MSDKFDPEAKQFYLHIHYLDGSTALTGGYATMEEAEAAASKPRAKGKEVDILYGTFEELMEPLIILQAERVDHVLAMREAEQNGTLGVFN